MARLRLRIPGHLIAVVIGTLLSLLLASLGFEVKTIGTAFRALYPMAQQATAFLMYCLNLCCHGIFPTRKEKRLIGICTALSKPYYLPLFLMAILGAIESFTMCGDFR